MQTKDHGLIVIDINIYILIFIYQYQYIKINIRKTYVIYHTLTFNSFIVVKFYLFSLFYYLSIHQALRSCFDTFSS